VEFIFGNLIYEVILCIGSKQHILWYAKISFNFVSLLVSGKLIIGLDFRHSLDFLRYVRLGIISTIIFNLERTENISTNL